MRLQTKILLLLLPLLSLTLLGLGGLVYQQAQEEKYSDTYTLLEMLLSDFLQHHIQPAYEQQQAMVAPSALYQEQAQMLLAEYRPWVAPVHLFVFSRNGQMLAGFPAPPAAETAWSETIQQLTVAAAETVRGQQGRTIFVAAYFAPWDWVVVLSEDENQALAALSPLRLFPLGLALLGVLLIVTLLWLLLQKLLLRPVGILQEATQAIAERRPIAAIPLHSQDELGQLARAMEQASQAIADYSEQRDRFEAEISIRNRALEASVNGVIVCDALREDYPTVYVNPAFERITGYTAGELIGRSCWFLRDAKANHDAVQQIHTALRQQRPVSVELRSYHKNGRLYWSELRVAPIRDERGAVTHFIGIQTDISERKKAEQALQQSYQALEQRVAARTAELATANKRLRQENDERQRAEQMFRLFIDAAPDALVIVDRQGIMQHVNNQAETLFGYRREELIGQPVEWLVPARFAGPHRQQHDAYFEHPQFRPMGPNLELFGRKKSGAEFPIEVSLSPIKTAVGMLVAAAARDVTERKQAEEILRHAKSEAERANEAKTRFLAAASHDLRQPLQTISLLSGTLALKLTAPDLAMIVKKQQSAILTMQKMLGALLDISRLEAGVIQPQISVFPVAELLQQLHDDFAPAADRQGLQLRLMPCSASIRSDSTLLGQILENLLANAVKYTAKGKILVGCRRQGRYLRIEVWDTGPGIPPEQQETIFEEFYQLDNPARDRTKGFGLGLAIVQRLARLLEYPVRLRSRPGKGSCFSILVPLEHAWFSVGAEANKPAEQVANTLLQAAQVLLIEDDPAVLQAAQLLLEVSGYGIVAVANSGQALAALQNWTPDLIISDYRLPGAWNGLELIMKIRQTIARQIPAVLVTGDTSVHKLRAAAASNCRVLYKPINPQELLALIRDLLDVK